jgi:hypothetical protein
MRRPRGVEWLAVVALAAAAFALVLDVVQIRDEWLYTPPKFVGDDFLGVVAPRKSENAANIVIGLAARDLAGGKPPVLIVPEDLDLLRAPVPGWRNQVQQALRHGTMRQMVADRLVVRDYDPAAWDSTLLERDRLRAYGQEVYGYEADANAPVDEVILVTDSTRTRIYVLPAPRLRLAPETP